MKHLLILAGMAVAAVSLQADQKICYEYPQNQVKLIHLTTKTISEERVEDIRKTVDPSLYRLILARSSKASKLHWHYLYLLKKESDAIVSYQSFECTPRKGLTRGFDCHGECDSGGITVDKNGNLIIASETLFLGDSVDLPEGAWEVALSDKGAILRSHHITCPETIAKEKYGDDKDVADSYLQAVERENDRSARYVCYTDKIISSQGGKKRVVYQGCQVSKYSCKEEGLLHFGHYSSALATDEALARCRHSKPRENR